MRVINDRNPSVVSLMACQGHGLNGLIKAHGKTIAIKPSQEFVDIEAQGKPKVYDEHLVTNIYSIPCQSAAGSSSRSRSNFMKNSISKSSL